MALTIILKKAGVSRGTWSAGTYKKAATAIGQAKVAGEVLKRDEGGGPWTIEFSGSTTCGTCGKVKAAPDTITL